MGGFPGHVLSMMQKPSHEVRLHPAVGYADTVTVVSQVSVIVGVGVGDGIRGPTATTLLTALLPVRIWC